MELKLRYKLPETDYYKVLIIPYGIEIEVLQFGGRSENEF